MNAIPAFPVGTILGYPRIGPDRELKRAVEAFWAGRIDAATLEATAAQLRASTRERLASLGLGRTDAAIPESFSFYDQVLDAAVTVGAVPERFTSLVGDDGRLDLSGYFTLARGEGDLAPLEMTKWFDSNYHYLVPEIGADTTFSLASDRLVEEFREGIEAGFVTRPVIVGPVTFLLLAKAADGAPADFAPIDRLDDLLPVYAELLQQLAAAGAPWVQLDEPALVSETFDVARPVILAAVERASAVLAAVPDRPAIFVAAPYGALGDALPVLAASGVEAIGVDLVKGWLPETVPGLEAKTVVAGVVDGHNVWRGDLAAAADLLATAAARFPHLAVSTSTSLLHVPYDVEVETRLDARLRSWLAFADQKVAQVATLARGVLEGRDAVTDELTAASSALADRLSAPGVVDRAVRDRAAALGPEDFSRTDYGVRADAQEAALGLPFLPTTTIGSFPQTGDIRRARAQRVAGTLSEEAYVAAMQEEISRVVALQESIGIDVIVHGEPERNDMVQYFAEHLDGFAVTDHGWVQSYGSRCTRPSLLWGGTCPGRPRSRWIGRRTRSR